MLKLKKFANIFLIAMAAIGAFGLARTDNFVILTANAAAADNIRGFAWSDNIGWISFNSIDCDIDGDGVYEGAAESSPSGCPISGNVVPYGVNLNGLNNLSGYAWSDSVGWISFNETGCPSGGNCQPRLVGGDLFGWARSLSNGGGWDGWISLNSKNCDTDNNTFIDIVCGGNNVSDTAIPFKISKSGNKFIGYAWGGEAAGWISFDCAGGGNCAVTILLSPASVSVTPSKPNIAVKANQDFIAIYKDQFGVPVAAAIVWTSSNPAVGTIDSATGKFTAVSAGKTVITATSGAVSGTAEATVYLPSINSGNVRKFSEIVSGFIDWFLAISAGLAILFIIIGGIKYIRSWGDSESAEKAKKIITFVVIGLTIILISYSAVVTLDKIING